MDETKDMGLSPEIIEEIHVRARERYKREYYRVVTGPFGVSPPNYLDFFAEEYDRRFLRELAIS